MEEIIKSIIGIIIMFFFIFIMPQLLILNGLRYLRYKKIIDYSIDDIGPFSLRDKEARDHYIRNRAKIFITFGILFNIFFFFIFFIWTPYPYLWLKIIHIFFLLAAIYFFYWYWHTKEDPFRRFHYEQKIWEDPKDKKKQEPK